MPKKFILVCLLNFFIAALMGLALRFSFIDSVGLNYRFLTHAHSHVAMLGWVYLMLYVLIIHYFIPEKKPVYNRLFWLTEIAVIGMMISFPFQGYAAVSITFSTLHIFCSYYFVYLIWTQHNITSKATELLLKTALTFMLMSTIGVWCLGPAVSMLGQASAFYQIAIQFFLHFQFNGWFLIAVISVFFYLLKLEDSKHFRYFYWLLLLATILTVALPIQWFAPHKSLVWFNSLGVILQVVSLLLFLKLVKPKHYLLLQPESKLSVYLYVFAIGCFVLKVFLSLLSMSPEFSEVILSNRNFVIGFIHLVMLGMISGFLFAFILKGDTVKNSSVLYFGVFSFLTGFVLTEILLLIQGYQFLCGNGLIPNYYGLLFIFSIFLPLGIGLILLYFITYKNYESETSKTT